MVIGGEMFGVGEQRGLEIPSPPTLQLRGSWIPNFFNGVTVEVWLIPSHSPIGFMLGRGEGGSSCFSIIIAQ